MNILELGAIGELVGGVAVVATLIYLALQVRQNTAQSRRDGAASGLNFPAQLCLMTESEENAEVLRSGLRDFSSLTPNQAACFNSLLLGLFAAFVGVLDLHKAGLITPDEFEATEGNFARFIIAPGGREWWDQTKQMYPARGVDAVEEAVSKRQLSSITESWGFLASK